MDDLHGIKITDNLRNYYKWLEVTRSPGGGGGLQLQMITCFMNVMSVKKQSIFFFDLSIQFKVLKFCFEEKEGCLMLS